MRLLTGLHRRRKLTTAERKVYALLDEYTNT
jgi:hypothetical protein